MMTREELYGGSTHFEYTVNGETFSIPNGSDIRVWTFTNDDNATVAGTLRLPDPLSLRRAGGAAPEGAGAVGGPIYYLINATNFAAPTETTVEDHLGNPLGFFDTGEMLIVSLFSPFVAGGLWCFTKKVRTTEFVGNTTGTVSFGSNVGLQNQARMYSYENDVWTDKLPFPILGGVAFSCTAADALNPGGNPTFFTAVMNDDHLQQFEDVEGAGMGTYTTKAQPSNEAAYTGLGDSSGGIFGSSVLGDLLYFSNGGIGGNALRATEYYDIAGDQWLAGPSTPASLGAFGQTAVCDEGFDNLNATALFVIPTDPDSVAGVYALLLFSTVFVTVRDPPWPWGHSATSMMGIAPTMHIQNGGFDVNSLNFPGFSTNSHYEYAKDTDVWSALPLSPVVANGMGIRGTSFYRDRYTFGMGADKDHPGTPFVVHYEYNLDTRVYRTRGTVAWGDSERREGAWAMADTDT